MINFTKRVYVAGPYTKPNANLNTKRAIEVGHKLALNGFAPFIPHLSHFWDILHPMPYEFWTEYDLQFLPACDFLVRIPGESSGADREAAYATHLEMPVFLITDIDMTIKDICDYFKLK